jgi:hypothetical protein
MVHHEQPNQRTEKMLWAVLASLPYAFLLPGGLPSSVPILQFVALIVLISIPPLKLWYQLGILSVYPV